jgi:hypothetical protein
LKPSLKNTALGMIFLMIAMILLTWLTPSKDLEYATYTVAILNICMFIWLYLFASFDFNYVRNHTKGWSNAGKAQLISKMVTTQRFTSALRGPLLQRSSLCWKHFLAQPITLDVGPGITAKSIRSKSGKTVRSLVTSGTTSAPNDGLALGSTSYKPQNRKFQRRHHASV